MSHTACPLSARRIGAVVRLATTLCTFAVLALCMATITAIGRSQERLACYRQAAKSGMECPSPTWFDKGMAALVGSAGSARKG